MMVFGRGCCSDDAKHLSTALEKTAPCSSRRPCLTARSLPSAMALSWQKAQRR